MKTTVKERPILMRGPMVRAILEGRKTQTRRLIKPQPWYRTDVNDPTGITSNGWWWLNRRGSGCHSQPDEASLGEVLNRCANLCPYGRPGDRLWVRETWAASHKAPACQVAYRADGRCFGVGGDGGGGFVRIFHGWLHDAAARGDQLGVTLGRSLYGPWRPSIHMPRWASRITLEITGVRVERVQAISEADALAEGSPLVSGSYSHRGWFRELWNEINGRKEGYRWEDNCWVWVLTFRRIES